MAKFNNGSGQSKTAKKRGGSRWAGVTSQADRTPIIAAGKYTAKHKGGKIKNESGEWAVITFEVVESDGADATAPGEEAIMLQGLGDRYNIGAGKVKAYVMALIGCPSDDAYDEFDEDGEFLDAMLGEENDRSEEAKSYLDTEIEFTVRRGKEIVKDGKPTGDYYREFSWVTNEPQDD